MLSRFILFASFLFVAAATIRAQARPTASRTGDLQIGGGVVSADSDYDYRIKGFFGYADFDLTRHLGAEFEIHQLYSNDGQQVHERTYEIGARYHRTYGRLVPYAKLMAGRGVFNFPYNQANLAYNLYAIGGGLDVKVLRHVNVRGEFEYQRWLNFQADSLTPTLVSFGAAYHF